MRNAMNRLGLLWLVCLLALGVCAPALAEEGENLLSNGGFEEVSGDMPAGWYRGMWVTTAGTTYIESSEDAHTGERAAMVDNVQPNDARLEQTVRVEPQTFYKLSAWVKAEDCGEGLKGANVSFADVYGTSPDVHDTDGEWVELTLYARTARDQREVTVMARVGGYGSENTGRAWFDDISLVQVDEVPADAAYVDLATPEPQTPAQVDDGGPGAVEIATLFAVAAAYVGALWLAARGLRAVGPARNELRVLIAVLSAAAAVRLVLAPLVAGYGVDIACFTSWSLHMANVGPAQFYQTVSFCDYPPGYLYVLLVDGLLMNLLGVTGGPGAELIVKLAPIACDIAGAALVYRLVRESALCAALGEGRARGRTALLLAGLYAFNPAAVVTSACWGQADAVLALLVLLALWLASDGRWRMALPVYVAACLVKPQALMLAPLGAAVLVKQTVLAVRGRDGRALRDLGLGLLFAALTALTIVLPFSPGQPADWLIAKYTETLSSYNHGTLSTGNLMYLLGGNWVDASLPSPLGLSYSALGWTLMALSIAFVIALYVLDARRGSLFELSALLLAALYALGPKMHERYLLPVLVLLLISYAVRPDRRTLWVFGIYTATLTVNVGTVLAFEHLIAPNEWVGYLLGVAVLAGLAVQAWTAVDHCLRGRAMPLPPADRTARSAGAALGTDARLREELNRMPDARLHMRGRDWALMLGVTAAYSVLAFFNLGSTKAPQTLWQSSSAGEQVVFDLGEERTDFNVYVYVGISDPSYTVSVSSDGVSWSQEELMNQGECFLWIAHCAPLVGAEGETTSWSSQMRDFTGRYVRLTMQAAGAVIGEVGFVDSATRTPLPVASVSSSGGAEGHAQDPALLCDEQDAVPDVPSYLNGTYFDEIYHARTGYEHLHGLHTFEWTHPPLGKLLMAACIGLFGMTPFGWRFAGTVSGILMLPVMYLLGKQLFKKTAPAFYATALLALDCMHFTQTRIATIDTFVVLFIMAMYLCMLRWTQMSFHHQKLSRTFVPLALSGVFMSLAIASKWTGLYAAVGLAAIFFARLYGLWRQAQWARAHESEDPRYREIADAFPRRAGLTILLCCVFFVVLPVVVYCLCYIPQLAPDGPVTLQRIWELQQTMFGYHSGLGDDDHFFRSPWWQWPLILKPMWYYDAPFKAAGTASVIYAMGNPAVWWVGLAALLYVLYRAAWRCGVSPLIGRGEDVPVERPLAFLAIGFLSQYLPWILVPRSTFIYHYFPSVPFIILCTAQVWRTAFRERRRAGYVVLGAHLAVAAALFVLFYPVISGLVVPRAWLEACAWFKNWLWF